MVLGGVGWDKKEFLESNLHVYGGDDTKIVIYSMGRWPKGVGGEKSSRKWRSEVSKNVLSPQTSFKVASQLRVEHWIRDEQREATNIFKMCDLHIKCLPTNSLAALMWM